MKYLLLSLGAIFGAMSRYLLSGAISKNVNSLFPYGTLVVNIVGAFVFGILFSLLEDFTIPSDLKVFLFVGFLGSFTTFSSYIFEIFSMLKEGEYKLSILYFLYSNVISLLMFVGGYIIIKYLIKLVWR